MSLHFEDVYLSPLRDVSLRFDDGMIAGLVGPDGSGKGTLLRLAAGRVQPLRGRVQATPEAILVEIGPDTRTRLAAALAASPRVLLLDHALAVMDGVSQVGYIQQLQSLRRRGAVVVVSSHDLDLLERICDVVVALENGSIFEQGDPGLVVAHYRRRILEQSRAAGGAGEIAPSSRHGDRRAEIQAVEILGENGAATVTVRSGEPVTVRARLCFHEPVESPVIGIQIRSRIGVVVYGTNTELEQLDIGPRRKGETVEVEFQFRCDLCPQEYTLTVASHDPDGTPHDWLEEALLFSVIDDRYTAGVANLRARVEIR